MRLTLVILLLGVAAAAPVRAEACRQVGELAPLLEKKQVLLFGELHGTVESPAFVGNLLCLAAEKGTPATLALELPHEEQERVDAFLASDGGEAARKALLGGPPWTRDYQDGRTSRAMFDLIEKARGLARAGKPVAVFLFDAAEPTRSRDLEMANRLAEAMNAQPERLFLVLAGNFHTQLTQGREGYPAFEPMGYFLESKVRRHQIKALDVAYSGGSAWICTSGESRDCGESQVGGTDQGADWKITLGKKPTERGHHGRYYLGALHASPPAAKL